jgi:hypothetical protein
MDDSNLNLKVENILAEQDKQFNFKEPKFGRGPQRTLKLK